jgi:tetratricopeptide (TPR) repeat protein
MKKYSLNKKQKISYLLRFSLLNILLIQVILLICSLNSWGFRNLKEGDTVNDFSLKDISGNTHSISQLKGKTILILYWRVGQERSNEALKELKVLQGNIPDQSFVIMAITKDIDKITEIKEIKKSLDIPFNILLDNDAGVYSDFGVFVFPSTALIDRNGVFRFYYGGFRSDYKEELYGQVRLLLGLITPEGLKAEREIKTQDLTENQKRAINHINLAKTLRSRGMDQKAFEESQKALDFDPNNVDGHILLGLSFLDKNETDKALHNFQKALELNPRSTEAKIGLGTAYRLKGQTDKALEILKNGINLCPDSAVIHFELGKIYESLGKTDEALKQYKTSAECSLKMKN